MNKYRVISVVAVFAALLFTSCQLPVDPDGRGGGDREEGDPVYSGPISELNLDINMTSEIDIWTELISEELDGGIIAEGYDVRLSGGVRLLAGAPYQTFAYTPFYNPRLLGKEKGYVIERGLTQDIKPEDYFYGDKLFALGGQVDNQTGKLDKMNGDMVSNDTRYWCVMMGQQGDARFGWIEYKCDGEVYLNEDGHWDADITVTEVYISEELNKPVIAGEK